MTNKEVVKFFLNFTNLKVITEDGKEYNYYNKGMKLIIAGTRTFDNYEYLKEIISKINNPISEIISGHSKGADLLGEKYAKENKIKLTIFEADWNNLGKSAGPIRNKKMAEYCDCAIIFWDGESRGSKSMIEEMKKINKPFKIIKI